MANVLTISPALATEGALIAEKTAARAAEAGLAARCTVLETELRALAARVAALEAPALEPQPVPAPLPTPTPTGLVFSSDWSSGTPQDTWDDYFEFNNNTGVYLMSVIAGAGPHGENALKVLQRGSTFAANLQKKNLFPPGTDFYVRYYFRTDDTSPNGDHIATCEFYNYQSLTYLRKYGGPTSWQPNVSMYGCNAGTGIYPRSHWHPRGQLQNGVWYRFEYFVHFTTPLAIEVHPRIYDVAGTLLYQDADWLQEDYGGSGDLSYLGNDHWDLASYYAASHDFCCVPQWLTAFSVGNNGQAGAADTGLPWWFAKVAISTAGWIGA